MQKITRQGTLLLNTYDLIVRFEYHHVEHRLNCSSISHDGSLVVGGFSDSSVKVSPFRSNVVSSFFMLFVFLVGKMSLVSNRSGICQRLANQQKCVS